MSSQNPEQRSRQTVLVTGGSGFIGSHLAQRLATMGFQVRLLLRKTSSLKNIGNLEYQRISGDINDPSSLARAVTGVDYIFHCAGLVKATSPEMFIKANRDGTLHLLQAVLKGTGNIKRFVYISSQAAAGPCSDENPITEHDTPKPVSYYGKSKLAGEQVVLDHKDELPVTIVRPPAVFGPRDKDVFQFFKGVRLGQLLKFGGKEAFVSMVYVKDLVDGIIKAATNTRGWGEIFFINSIDKISQVRAQEMIAEVMRVEIKPLRIPVPVLKPVALIYELSERLAGRVPDFSLDKVRELSCRYWLSSSAKANELLGFQPQYEIEEALRETYEWYIQEGWL